MAANLRDRLNRIRELKESEAAVKAEKPSRYDDSSLTLIGWESCGFKTAKREVVLNSPFKSMKSLPAALAVLVPDLAGRELPSLEDFLFFDLETTGLSGGAGTTAFLAAFGKLTAFGKPDASGKLADRKLRITQYLLLDYPGENDFLDLLLAEFKNENSVIVSYNGKCFDSQILKTRCLMNRMKPPEYFHADLLHPSRRLWKSIINDCSQGSVEERILGIKRENDIPGALAPDIWFEFLKTGETERLSGICDHNVFDIAGLSSILAAMIRIASDPLGCEEPVFDLERLALFWRNFVKRNAPDSELQITGGELLRRAAEKKYPRAVLFYAQETMKKGDYQKGRKMLIKVSESEYPLNIKLQALRTLAIDSERKQQNIAASLEYVNRALELVNDGSWKNEFDRRKERLEKKLQLI
jgi:uncharacterized protein YprB with RNaseH-like and TPR domain